MNKIILFSFIIFVGLQHVNAGGGWTAEKNKGFFKFSQSSLRSDGFYGPDGTRVDVTTISLYTTSIYGEYGFTDRFTGVIYAPLFIRSTINEVQFRQSGLENPGDQLNNIGDLDLGFKYRIAPDSKFAIALGLTFGIPLGTTSGGDGGILQTGDGEFNQLLTLEISKSFNKTYGTLLVGFNHRTKGFSEEFRYGIEVGRGFGNKINGAVKVFGVQSFQNGDASGGGGNSLFSNNTEYLAIAPEIAYQFHKKIGLAGSASIPISGQMILSKPSYNLGLYLKL